MNEYSRLNAVYADELNVQREQIARRTRHTAPRRRTTRKAFASTLHRLADRLDGE